jgi:hypothetical protein
MLDIAVLEMQDMQAQFDLPPAHVPKIISSDEGIQRQFPPNAVRLVRRSPQSSKKL